METKEGEIREYLASSLEQRLAAVEAQIVAQEARLVGRTEADTNGNGVGEREGMGGAESAGGEEKGSESKWTVVRRGLKAVGDVEDMDAHVGEEADVMEGEDHFEFGLDEPGNDDGDEEGIGEGDGEEDVGVAGDADEKSPGRMKVKEEGTKGGDDKESTDGLEVPTP